MNETFRRILLSCLTLILAMCVLLSGVTAAWAGWLLLR
jgi:hypothetical protein